MGGPLYVHLSDSAICYEMRTSVLRYNNILLYKTSMETSGEGSSVAIAVFNLQTRGMPPVPRFLMYFRLQLECLAQYTCDIYSDG